LLVILYFDILLWNRIRISEELYGSNYFSKEKMLLAARLRCEKSEKER